MQIPLRRINHVLFALVITVNLYIFTAPLLPRVTYWWQHNHTNRQHSLSVQLHAKPTPASQPNRIVIPDMLLGTPVLETSAANVQATLNQGVVHVPTSSTPDKGGNTVIIGHRFSYTAPKGIFYYLDKLHPGSEIGLFWNNKRYTYTVVSTREVPPTEISVEAPTKDARLTLYTCTPLWNPTDRLVIVAKPEVQK